MFKKKHLFFFIVIFFHILSYCQQYEKLVDSIIVQKKRNDFKTILNKINRLDNSHLKTLFLNDYYYQTSGTRTYTDSLLYKELKNREFLIGTFLFTDYLELGFKGKDSLIFNLLKQSFKDAKKNKDTLIANELLNRINWHLFGNSYKIETFNNYVKEYKNFAKDSIDKFNSIYYEIGYKMYEIDELAIEIDSNWFNKKFKKLNGFANNPFLKGRESQFLGIYYGGFLNKHKRAIKYNKEAILFYKKDTLFYSSKGVKKLLFNNAIEDYKTRNFKKAIPVFKNDIKLQKDNLYKFYGYEWLYKSYEGLKKHDSAHFYFKKMVKVKDEMDQKKHARIIREIDIKYNLEGKERELKFMIDNNKSLRNQLLTVLPILGFISLVLIVTYFLFKRYKKKSNILEEEQSETLQKLDELKKIVIKNHIILKDKTKVYIADLMYIKSDDHYLNVFLSDGKNHFVRGKLNAITEELPPNFIRCHRSYIVNSNFIKQVNSDIIILIDKTQIPLSRSYKDKF